MSGMVKSKHAPHHSKIGESKGCDPVRRASGGKLIGSRDSVHVAAGHARSG
jgi:hypothetical protein